MVLELTIVGCSGSFPGPDSAASCYLVEHDNTKIVLDMGNGSLGALQRLTDMYDLDAVVLSHTHLDHCADLCAYFVARSFRPGGSDSTVPVYGTPGVTDRMNQIFDGGRGRGMGAEFEFHELGDQPIEIGPIRITSRRMRHVIESHAVRLEADDAALVYSGDTGPCPELASFAVGSDLALFEASFLDGDDNPPNLHLTGGEAAEAAARADVGRLLLTHLVPWHDPERVLADAQAGWSGENVLARTGLKLRV